MGKILVKRLTRLHLASYIFPLLLVALIPIFNQIFRREESHVVIKQNENSNYDNVGLVPVDVYNNLPLLFEVNNGQYSDDIDFVSHGLGYNMYLESNRVTFSLFSTNDSNSSGSSKKAFSMSLVGANTNPISTGIEKQLGKVNYFAGNDPANWRTDVSTYKKVTYTNVYP